MWPIETATISVSTSDQPFCWGRRPAMWPIETRPEGQKGNKSADVGEGDQQCGLLKLRQNSRVFSGHSFHVGEGDQQCGLLKLYLCSFVTGLIEGLVVGEGDQQYG